MSAPARTETRGAGGAAGAARPIDALVAEIGSTTTVVSAFDGLSDYPATTPRLLGQGVAATSVAAGDVTVGVGAARAALEEQSGPLAPRLTLATSSAAGGLRMTVHGLTQRMTAMAAREAALGAGAVVTYQTAGLLRDHDLRKIEEARPSLMLLAGGVEGGDCETVLANARRLCELSLRPIVVYGGNSVVCDDSRELLEQAGFRVRLTRQRLPGGRRARHRAGPRGHPRRLRGAHHPRPRHGTHRRGRERAHPADAGRRAARRRASGRRSRRSRGRRRRRGHHRRALDHRRQSRVHAHPDRAPGPQPAHGRRRPGNVRERGPRGRHDAQRSSARRSCRRHCR